MLFAELEPAFRNRIVETYTHTEEFLRPLRQAIKLLPNNHPHSIFLEEIADNITYQIRVSIYNYYQGEDIPNPEKWYQDLIDLLLNILILKYKPFYDSIRFSSNFLDRQIFRILHCDARLIYHCHLIWQ